MKPSFGQRMGIVPLERPFQDRTINESLRNATWNTFYLEVMPFFKKKQYTFGYSSDNYAKKVVLAFWVELWELPAEESPNSIENLIWQVKSRLLRDNWFEVYELIEFTVDTIRFLHQESDAYYFCQLFNDQFEKYNSAYRFISGIIAPITNSQEIDEIETAVSTVRSYTALRTCNDHLSKSITFLSNLEKPDYSNSVKEAVSAMEALAKILEGDKKGTLGVVIKNLSKSLGLHQALIGAIDKLYGYSSEKAGVRHGHVTPDETDFDEAKFILVTSCSIINFLVAKASKEGLILQE